jgi:hypothetical protein
MVTGDSVACWDNSREIGTMASATDAELILKLYELRTEATMRAARKSVLEMAGTFEEMAAVQRAMGTEANAYWRQVMSYWDMAAAFVLHDSLDAELFIAANGEPFFYYAKFTPFLEEWKQAFGMPFMGKTGMIIEKYPSAKAKYEAICKRIRPNG